MWQLRRREQPAVCGTERSLGSCPRSWEPRARLGHRARLPTAELCCLGFGVLTFSCGFVLFQRLYCTSLYLPAPQAPRDSLGASQRNRAVPWGRAARGRCSGGKGRSRLTAPMGRSTAGAGRALPASSQSSSSKRGLELPEFCCRFISMQS